MNESCHTDREQAVALLVRAGVDLSGLLQCVAVCHSVLQCAVVFCSVLQCAAVCSSEVQCVAFLLSLEKN